MRPELRTAVLEWSRRQAAGELPGFDWVDDRILVHGQPFAIVRGEDGAVRFRHVAYGRHLPPPMVESAREAQEEGEPTALESLLALFARSEWLIASRQHFWAPYGPVPALLASLVEAYGIDAEIHGDDRDTLARLLANLPAWYPRRGDPERAGWIFQEAAGVPHGVVLDQTPPEPMDELFACRSAGWFAQRSARPTALRIERGFVHALQHDVRPCPEDVLIGWVPGKYFPHRLLRLLPAWASVRLHDVGDR